MELGGLSSQQELETSEAVRLYGFFSYASEAFKALSDEEQERLKMKIIAESIQLLITEIVEKN